eukprot:gnl/Hemi2/15919_TR5264_c0_g1_i1.p1 gnl/Hemi2/15919_TR5264_c0_g1~~gnl/Hemi2/15919_TR5264_c0_g1_i1.p1  ORF type:complete len:481 (+),score=158.98 gnl/Hemi2/15919_TR5264_c0_g1_i1:154-1596(+)
MQEFHRLPIAEYQRLAAEASADAALVARIRTALDGFGRDGYAIIPDILTAAECDAVHAQFWTILSEATAGRLSRPTAAEDLAKFRFGAEHDGWPPNKHGIFEDGAWAHMPFTYAVRTHPRVLLVHALMYGTGKRLVVSTDRLNYQLPAEWLPRQHRGLAGPDEPVVMATPAEAPWLHLDQSLTKAGLHCVQEGSACLECVPGTHLEHQSLETLMDRKIDAKNRRADWIKFTDEDKAHINEARPELFRKFRSINAPKGAMVLWDSRLWHQGGRARKFRPTPLPRFVIYVCAQPELTGAPAWQDRKRNVVFAKHKATPHWPLQGTGFPPPRTYGKDPAVFNFAPHLLSLEAALDFPVLASLFGLKISDQLDLLAGLPTPTAPFLDFAPESGVNVLHPPKPAEKKGKGKGRKAAVSSGKKEAKAPGAKRKAKELDNPKAAKQARVEADDATEVAKVPGAKRKSEEPANPKAAKQARVAAAADE